MAPQEQPMVEMEEDSFGAAMEPAPAPMARSESLAMADDTSTGYYQETEDREQYQEIEQNPIIRVSESPVSTFSIDVDTGAYSNVRRFLNNGQLPRKDAVRVEELINYFSYDYPLPENREVPFRVNVEIAPTPWNPDTLLLMIGIKGYEIERAERPPSNLVFLLDVSGSMNDPDKLPLLKSAFSLLSGQLTENDRVSIVVYAGAAGVILEPTPGNEEAQITAALNRLSAGGSTAGGEGIELAYAMARQAYIEGGINRILLATDGDFNVGTTNFEALLDMVERERESGVSLTTLGFGQGNYNEQLMEQLADAGNGNYAYIDTLSEANKVLVTEMSSTLFTIAKDVKIQIEFNPAVVAEYRQIGYENRQLLEEDFANDAVDAGDIGAGHTVTALYEIALVGGGGERLEPRRYDDNQPAELESDFSNELAFLKLRYKLPESDTSTLMETPLTTDMIQSEVSSASLNYRWAAAVAAFAELLRDGRYTGDWTYDQVLELARTARGDDPFGYRGEFLNLVNLAKSLSPGGSSGNDGI
ncbi:MAG: VWA domain-containing protein [Desulfovibrio sp.]|nr:MAG: VWA domain-containing protein [Desulfovibrio sp.]